MAEASDSELPGEPSSSANKPKEEYLEQWNALCEELGTSDPNEVLARVQTLKREMDRLDAQEDPHEEGLVTISEVEEVFREMNRKIEKLRERNAALAERLEKEDNEMGGAFQELYQKSEQLLESLDVTTMDEAQERVRQLNERLEGLYQEKEQLVQAGLSDAKEALDELSELREERDALRQERNQLQAERKELESELENVDADAKGRSADPDTSVLEAAVIVRDRIGVSSPNEAQAFTRRVKEIYERVHSRAAAHDIALDDAPDDAMGMLEEMAAQLDALPDPNDEPSPTSNGDTLPAEIGDVLGIHTVKEARELESLIDDTTTQLDELTREHRKLERAGLTVDDALTMIDNMEAQLTEMYHGSGSPSNGVGEDGNGLALLDESVTQRIADHLGDAPKDLETVSHIVKRLLDELDREIREREALQNAERDTDDKLSAIEEELGISSKEEAEHLSQLARQTKQRLTSLYQEKATLEELGLSSIEDAVDLIESMEDQLVDLYEDKKHADAGGTTGAEEPTREHEETLSAEQEKLEEALGLSAADEIIEMVQGLTSQLDELYKARDADVDPEERYEVLLWDRERDPSAQEEGESSQTGATLPMNSMEYQLEALYREKETLLHHGFSNARQAVSQVQTQQKQIDALQRENHTYEKQFDHLESELGTAQASRIVELVDTLESASDHSLEDILETPSEASSSHEYGVDLEAASPFVPEEILVRLEDMDSAELDALEVGIMSLGDDGTVQYLNEAALQLPGLQSIEDRSTVIGDNFFLDLAPSTNNNLFYGRFQKGQRRGKMDARFPYTFVSPNEGPQSFAVHLHRKRDGTATWLLFRPT